MSNRFEILGIRYKIDDPSVLLVTGWFTENQQNDAELVFSVDGEKLKYETKEQKGSYVTIKRLSVDRIIDTQYFYWIKLPDNFEKKDEFCIDRYENGRTYHITKAKITDLLKLKKEVVENIDSMAEERGVFTIRGWIVSGEKTSIEIYDMSGNVVQNEIKYNIRRDVMFEYPEAAQENVIGYEIRLPEVTDKNVQLVIRYGESEYKKICCVSYNKFEKIFLKLKNKSLESIIYVRNNGLKHSLVRIIQKLKKMKIYVQNNGIKHTVIRIYEKLLDKDINEYAIWRRRYILSSKMLEQQKAHKFTYAPKISIVVPLYKTNEKYLKELIESIQAQTYSNWELCLSDGSGVETPLRKVVETYQKNDNRIKMVCADKALQISENTNAALKIATGEFIAFTDHDDLLTPDALYENVKILNNEELVDFIYSDEDKISMNGKEYFEPHFKPDFNLDLLRTINYICHFVVVRKSIVDEIGGLHSEFDGAQDYDFVLRCAEKTNHIYHIPKVLYHWRAHKDSTAENPESKMYAFENGERAVQEHYDRLGISAVVTMRKDYLGIYRSEYQLERKPLVSILIPNKDHIDDLKKCIDSIEKKSTYENLEYIIIENNSTEEKTFSYYKKLKKENERVKVVVWDGEFNYSAINNYGVSFANGEYLLFLNNDTEIINDDCIEELLGYCMRDDVGIVGARLFYPDDTIQHAGVIVGIGGVAGHCFLGLPKDEPGYFARAVCAQDYSAVTAACMMVKRSVFEAVNGFNEKLKVAFNDIDFCLRVREHGKLVVYNPYAELYHYESKSRGAEDTAEKQERFIGETDRMKQTWKKILEEGDPYYNLNLTLVDHNFSLKK